LNNFYQPGSVNSQKAQNAPGEALAWVERGKLHVSHPEEGPYPQVVPCQGIQLIVNGKACLTPTTIKKTDQVQLQTLTENRPGEIKIKVAKNEMAATLSLKPAVKVEYEAEDAPPTAYLKLTAKARITKLPPATLEEILNELAAAGITTGINQQNCQEAANCREEKEFLIAEGTPYTPGKDAQVKLFFNPQEKFTVEFTKENIVDFRKRFTYNCVEKGEVLAQKIPPVPGTPGISIFGRPVNPPLPKDIRLIAGKGARVDENAHLVYAAESGLPKARISGNRAYFEVEKVLIINGDVDISTGNIEFKGDVFINGSVCETMSVKATGNIDVTKDVTYATVCASGSLKVWGNVISSSLVSGGKGSFNLKIISRLRIFCNLVEELSNYIFQIQQNPALQKKINASPAVLIRFFLQEERFKLITGCWREIKKITEQAPKEFIPEELWELLAQGEKIFFTFQEVNLTEIKNIKEKAAMLLENLSLQATPEENIEIDYALNSDLKATGSVRVLGPGCFNTRIEAGGAVEIARVFRGGEIRARGKVKVGELGSASGTKTKIITGAASPVYLEKAWENAEVQIGNQVYRFLQEEENVKLKLDKKGNLIVF